jgi:serine protease Do
MSLLPRAAIRRLSLLLTVWWGAGVGHAQTATPPASPARPSTTATTNLTPVVVKSIRAVLRIEDCPPGDCKVPYGVGTAFHIGNGYAVSAYHVIFGARNLTARVVSNRRYSVEVVGYDDQADLALLQIAALPASTPSLPFATVPPAVGDAIVVIGNGNGKYFKAQRGQITALNVFSDRGNLPDGVLGSSAQIAPGDGGGPVMNARGEVVGVVSYLNVPKRPSTRVTAYAVPLLNNDSRLAELRQGVKRDAPTTGILLQLPAQSGGAGLAYALDAEQFVEFSTRSTLGLGTTPGVFFTQVAPGSPAAQAGLEPLRYDATGKRVAGDIITAVNGQRVVNMSEFDGAIRRYQPGERVTLTVLRAGQVLEIKVTLVGRAAVGN